MTDFGLYLVMTDPVAGYAACAEAAVKAGVRMLQLRMKRVSREAFLAAAKEVRAVTRGTSTCFIVNDDASVAAEAGADGVHVGQGDMPVAEVRRLYPELGVVGLSTHSIAQAEASKAQKPDYIGVGPVWSTPTKEIPDAVLGVETAMRMVRSVECPAVCIGGIDAERLPILAAAGAKNAAIVRAVCSSPDPYSAIRRLQRLLMP